MERSQAFWKWQHCCQLNSTKACGTIREDILTGAWRAAVGPILVAFSYREQL
jgi:hypothetical protein